MRELYEIFNLILYTLEKNTKFITKLKNMINILFLFKKKKKRFRKIILSYLIFQS